MKICAPLLFLLVLTTKTLAYDESDCTFYRHIKPLEKLNFLVCSIGIYLPPHIHPVQRYDNEPIKGLLIGNSTQVTDDSIFGSFNSVTYYGLMYHSIEHITKDSLDYLTFLEGLDVSNGHLMRIDFNSFRDFQHLRDLDLSKNKLDYLHPKLFEPLTTLEKVNLKGNKLMAVEMDMFGSNLKLSLVNLAENRIAYIHPLAFDGNHALRELYLIGNDCINVDYRQPRVQSLRFIFMQQCKETAEIINMLSEKADEAESVDYEDVA